MFLANWDVVMKRLVFLPLGAAALAIAISSPGAAQESEPKAKEPFEADGSWYYDPAPPKTPEYSIAQRKSMARAEQRMARIAIAKWHGYSPARPTHAGGSFTSIHNPTWGWSVGRPFSWPWPRATVFIVR